MYCGEYVYLVQLGCYVEILEQRKGFGGGLCGVWGQSMWVPTRKSHYMEVYFRCFAEDFSFGVIGSL